METQRHEIGMIGLGVMGRNMLLNMADHGFAVAGYDNDPGKVEALQKESAGSNIHGVANIQEFIGLLRSPRAIMVLVPAGPPVDSVIGDLMPHLEKGDLIIDAGNSYFKDTNTRARNLAAKGIQFLGVGVSGGEEGARHGPSIMPGGPEEAYERVRPLLEAVAAKVDGDPCVAYLGPGSAGHFVKTVHNGIEYALMQLLAETYDLMKRGLGLSDDQLRDVYDRWNQGELNGYLVEITSRIFSKVDEKTGKRLIDEILDVGTKWHRHVDLAKRHGIASAHPHHRPGGRDAGHVRAGKAARDGRRDLPTAHSSACRRPRDLPRSTGPRAPCRHDRRLRARHGGTGGSVRQVSVSSRSRASGANLAGRLHHPRGVAGGHPHGISQPA